MAKVSRNTVNEKSLRANKRTSEDTSDSEDDDIHPFPPFAGINSYPELQVTDNPVVAASSPSLNTVSSINKKFLALAKIEPPKEELPVVNLTGCQTLQDRLLTIAGQVDSPARKLNELSFSNGSNAIKHSPVTKACPLVFRKKNSDQVRLKSIESRQNLSKNRTQLIKFSLANVVSTTKETRRDKGKSGSGLQLFGDGEEEEVNADSVFKIRPQFEGKKGEQNLELSSKFANFDSRFTLDERFKDDSDAESEQKNNEGDLEDEKRANLSILNDIVGTSVETIPKDKNSSSVIITRYDPEGDTLADSSNSYKKEHVTKKTSTTEVKEDGKILTQEKATYHVASNIKDLFSGAQTGFSLLHSFANESNKDYSHANENEAAGKGTTFWQTKNPFKYDSSDSETEVIKGVQPDPVPFKIHEKERFFFKRKDKRFDGLEDFFLRNEENTDDVWYRFNNGERSELKLICKSKIKNIKRKSEKRDEVLRRLKRKARSKRKLRDGPQGSNAVPVGVRQSNFHPRPQRRGK